MAAILVCDGEQRAALAVVRSLGRRGHAVYVCSDRSASLAGLSRYTRTHAQVANPLREPGAYVQSVRSLVEEWGIDVLLPVTDASMLALLPARDSIPARLPFGTADRFRQLSDKVMVSERASRCGIAVPQQLRVDSSASIRAAELEYPLVLKPGRSVVTTAGSASKLSVQHIEGPGELTDALRSLPPQAYPLLLQQRIDGDGLGIFLLLHEGEIVAAFAHRRLREKPPWGGVSVFRESIPLDPRLLELSVALLRSYDWEGPAMVEYKVDRETGTPYIMEINARFWGSLQLAIDAGVDFPALLVDIALNGRPQAVRDYHLGIRSRWFLGDVDHLLLRLGRSANDLALPPGAPSRGRTVLDFLRASLPGSRNEVLRWSDPAPALRELIDWLQRR